MEKLKDDVKILEKTLENRTLYYFYQLSGIPRESGNEKAVSDYIYHWAISKGMQAKQDAVCNLLIKKEASQGYENAAPVLLQAHLDMVCDKEPDSTHNFKTDPILWNIEGDWIRSASGTSLGADCGVGVALIMSVLEDNDLVHPPLEVLLTVREETDMGGAYQVNQADFVAKRMINLDISPDNRLLAGSCGGAAVEMELPLHYEAASSEHIPFRLEVSGMKGGHSGADIHRGRGNAILLLAHLLKELEENIAGMSLIFWEGGNSRLAIPREAKADISVPQDKVKIAEQICKKFESDAREEYSGSAPELQVLFVPEQTSRTKAAAASDFQSILRAALLLPNGIQEMSDLMDGAVESSTNLGIVEMDDMRIRFIAEVRSTYPASRDRTVEKFRALMELLGGTCKIHSTYPEWRYKKESELRKKILEIYRRREGGDMEVFCAHAGNEIGILFSALGLEDAAAMGPSRFYFHSPNEILSITSTIRFEAFLKDVLSELIR